MVILSNSNPFDEECFYAIQGGDLNSIHRAMLRLYQDTKRMPANILSNDEMRDNAHIIYGALSAVYKNNEDSTTTDNL